MSIQDIASVSQLPGLDVAVSVAYELYQTAQNVKVYREQCRSLSNCCNILLLAFRDNSAGMEDSEMLKIADEVELIITRARNKTQDWASLSRVKSFLQQGEIKEGLDKLYKDIDMCMAQFHISSNLEIGRGLLDLSAMQVRDAAENREMLQNIIKNVDDMKVILGMQPTAVENFMQTIQEELQDEELPTTEPQQQALRQGLWELHRSTTLLPPMTELTGQVVKTSEYPVAFGASNDVYTGEWLGQEKVALKLARAVNQSNKSQKRFHKECDIWRTLQHPYVSRLYGIVYFGEHVYSVSPWMEHRDAITYITNHPMVDRSKLCAEVASGMEYLHLHKVVHGDLRGANILISETGTACISDFGLSKVIEEVNEMSMTTSGISPIRWQAPELVTPEDYGLEEELVTTATDVWSYGMLCLELMTGEKPYSNRPRDANVISDIVSGKIPDRPGPHVTSRGLNDRLWSVMLRCWSRVPSSRPSMTQIRSEWKSIQVSGDSITPDQGGTILTDSPSQLPSEIAPVESSHPSGVSTLPGRPLPQIPKPPVTGNSSKPIVSVAKGSLAASISNRPPMLSPIASSPSTTPHIQVTSDGALGLSLRTPSETSEPFDSRSNPRTIRTSLIQPPSDISPPRPNPSVDRAPPTRISEDLSPSNPNPHAVRAATRVSEDAFPSYQNRSANRANTLPRPLAEQKILSQNLKTSPIAISRLPHDHRDTVNGDGSPETAPTPSLYTGSSSDLGSTPSSLPDYFGSQFHRQKPMPDRAPSELGSAYSVEFFDVPGEVDVADASVVHQTRDGSVEAGTLRGFVEKLTTDSTNFHKDTEFREAFLTTYRAFASAEDVFRLLIRRFNGTDMDSTARQDVVVNTRFLVIVVLTQWLRQHGSTLVDPSLLVNMRNFSSAITSPPQVAARAKELVAVLDGLIRDTRSTSATSPSIHSQLEHNVPKGRNITPKGLAIALTILESDKFQTISAADLVIHLLEPNGRDNVANAKVTNRKLINWVKRSCIRPSRLEDRGDTLKFFVNTAEECQRLNNFSSMTALVTGLDSLTVTRLKLTRNHLDKAAQRTLMQLIGYLDKKDAHKAYRNALNARIGPCLPWIDIHVGDLEVIFSRNQEFVERDGRQLINFDRYMRISQRIKHILHYKDNRYELENHREAGPLAYLEAELRKIGVDRAIDEALEARSLELKKQEELAYDRRVLELQAVGFEAKVRN